MQMGSYFRFGFKFESISNRTLKNCGSVYASRYRLVAASGVKLRLVLEMILHWLKWRFGVIMKLF